MRTLINKILFAINILFGLGLLISYLAPYAEPEQFWFVSIIGLGYFFLLVTNVLFAIYWIFRWKKYVFFSIVVLALGYVPAGKFIRFNEQVEYPPIESIKVLSHNIRAFGLNGPQFQTEDGNKIFKFLDQELYDIYCFQEFFSSSRKDFSPYDSVKKVTQVKYRHVEFLIEFRGNFFGMATLSRYPIVEKGIVPFEQEGTNMCMYTDIDINGNIIRVYNMHLQSLGFREKDYAFVKNLEITKEKTIAGAKNITGRLKDAFIKRQRQAKLIREHIESSPHPVIVCGDFNDTPLSYSYEHIKGNLEDAFVNKGRGIGSTYNGVFPLLRIDYIFHSPSLNNVYYKRIKEDLSDHYPLAAYFTFEK